MGGCYLCKYIGTIFEVVSFSEDGRTSRIVPRHRLRVMTLRGTFGQQFFDSVKVVCDVMFGDLIDGG